MILRNPNGAIEADDLRRQTAQHSPKKKAHGRPPLSLKWDSIAEGSRVIVR